MTKRYSKVIEEDAEVLLKNGVNAMRGVCLKIRFLGASGAPDRLILLPGGRFYFVELKQTTGKLEPSQEIMFPKIERLGFKVHLLYGVDAVSAFLTQLSTP